jgi:hypothetical protein
MVLADGGGEPLMTDTLLSTLTYLATAFVAAVIGHYFTARHYRNRKVYEFAERRLDELYDPLCSCLGQLRADGELKVAIFQAKDAAWKEKCERRRFNEVASCK